MSPGGGHFDYECLNFKIRIFKILKVKLIVLQLIAKSDRHVITASTTDLSEGKYFNFLRLSGR